MKITKATQKLIDDAIAAERQRVTERTQYNGWSNYATWRVNLELIGDLDGDTFGTPETLCDLADAIQEHVESILDESGASGLVLDYASAFIDGVDWYEIARNFAEGNDSLAYDDNGYLVESSEGEGDDEGNE